MNNVSLTGHLTNDPARRDTNKGVVTSFRIAVDDRPERLWIDIEAWGHLAGVAASHLHHRRHIAITGRLRCDTYHDTKGQIQRHVYVIADRITFLDRPNDTPTPAPANQIAAAL
jgi:single-stranded DNA-binding protein